MESTSNLRLVSDCHIDWGAPLRHALKTLEKAEELYRKRYDHGTQLDLELLEIDLVRATPLLITVDADETREGLEEKVGHAATLAMLLGWIYLSRRRRLYVSGGSPTLELGRKAAQVCVEMLPWAYSVLEAKPHCYYSLLLTQAQISTTRQGRFARIKEVAKGVSSLADPDQRALLFARIGELYRNPLGPTSLLDRVRSGYWKLRAMRVADVSAETRDEILDNL